MSKYQSQIDHLRNNYKRVPLDLRPEEYEALRKKAESENSKPITIIKKLIRDYLDS